VARAQGRSLQPPGHLSQRPDPGRGGLPSGLPGWKATRKALTIWHSRQTAPTWLRAAAACSRQRIGRSGCGTSPRAASCGGSKDTAELSASSHSRATAARSFPAVRMPRLESSDTRAKFGGRGRLGGCALARPPKAGQKESGEIDLANRNLSRYPFVPNIRPTRYNIMANQEIRRFFPVLTIILPTRVKLRATSPYGESTVPIIRPTRGSRYQIRRCGRATFLRRGVERARGSHAMALRAVESSR
jgi:hypothetical protein